MALIEAEARVRDLEKAIVRLNSVKKHLNTNAAEIHTEIHNSIYRNIECLESREASLCEQVKEVVKMKEESLHRQQQRLTQALSVLTTGLALVREESAPEEQLIDTLDRLKQIDLSPEETPYISFRADHLNLRDSILQYGRVDANGLPLMNAFDDPGNPSASLPRQVEEYEDADHHIFYKPVIQQSGAQKTATSINVSIPKLSNRVEDWLQKKVVPDPSAPEVKMSEKRPALRPNQLWAGLLEGAPSNNSTPGSSCSLTNWLTFIKQHPDLEEEHDFEIVDNTDRVSTSSRGRPAMDRRSAEKDFFCHIDKDLSKWIKPMSRVAASNMDFDSSNIFTHIPQDTQVWLSKAYRQLTALETLPKDFFTHVSRDLSSWLRTRAPVKQSQNGSPTVTAKPIDMDQWLLKKKPSPTQTSPVVLPKVSSPVSPAATTLTSPIAPVTIPLTKPITPINLTPSPTKSQATTASSLTDSTISGASVELDCDKWLLKKSQKLAEPMFTHIKPLSDPSWLVAEPVETVVESSVCDWLLIDGRRSEVESAADGGKSEAGSDGWSVCSSGASSDQFSREVAVDYYNKWLL